MSSSDKSPANWQDYTSAILSGFLGEWLHQRRNPMASAMELRFEDQVLSPASPDITPEQARPTIILLIHGLTELETIFDYPGRPGENYGTELAAHMDATPLRLRYNTGRHISSNGDELDQALEQLLANWPVAVEKLILIGHSMGGLVTRSACHHAQQHQSAWISKLSACVYIGSPHEGSWLAKAAHKTADVMGRAPRDYLRAVSDFLNIRSPGIHDLTEGDIYPDREDFQQPPLIDGVRHYAIAGLLAAQSGHPINILFGDALVQESSATGANQKAWALTDTATFPNIDHIRLTHHPDIYQKLQEWLV